MNDIGNKRKQNHLPPPEMRERVACHVDAENMQPLIAQIGLDKLDESVVTGVIQITGRPDAVSRYRGLGDGRYYDFAVIEPGPKGNQRADVAISTEAAISAFEYGFRMIAIFTSDGDLAECACRLRRRNRHVIIVGEQHAPKNLRRAANQFVEVGTAQKRDVRWLDATRLVQTVWAVNHDGWVTLARLGNELRERIPHFQYQNYGCDSLKSLLEAFPTHFELTPMNGVPAVRCRPQNVCRR